MSLKPSPEWRKRLLDLGIAVPALVFLTPVLLLIAALIRLDSRGAILFRQDRIGKDGRVFRMYKFRTMIEGGERTGSGLFNYSNDPRVTRVGGVLRATSLDELPQLFNVIKGEMSLVGPRPPVEYELGDFRDFDANLRRRFDVKPGVTGLAQINGRNELSWDQKIAFDLEYVDAFREHGIWLDLKVLAITVVKVIRGDGRYELPSNAADPRVSDEARPSRLPHPE
jgi:lipopolysaccharide/colanic/teichoic acid biosynthesis glycosyltransferase